MLNMNIFSLATVATETVEITAERLVQLERLAGLGRFVILIILMAVVLVMMHLIIKAKAESAVNEFSKSALQSAAEQIIIEQCAEYAKYGKQGCVKGIIFAAIQEQIKESCQYDGEIYRLVKSNEITSLDDEDY